MSLLLTVTVICCAMFAPVIFFDCLGTVTSLHNDCNPFISRHIAVILIIIISSKFHSTCNIVITPCNNPGGKRVPVVFSAADYASIIDKGMVLTNPETCAVLMQY